MSIAAEIAPIFQTSRTAALVPADARNKKLLRAILADFADQFAVALAQRLRDYCSVSKSKTVTAATLSRVAEDLVGAGAAKSPEGLSAKDVSKVMIYSRFKKNIKPLRTDAACPPIAAAIGFNFLLYVQSLVDRAFAGSDAKDVTQEHVIANLERPNVYSPSGLPCIAYRFNPEAFATKVTAAAKRDSGASEDKVESAASAATSEPEKKPKAARKPKKEAAAAEVVSAAPAAEEPKKPAAKRSRAKKEAGADAGAAGAAEGAGAAAAAAAAPAKKARKSTKKE